MSTPETSRPDSNQAQEPTPAPPETTRHSLDPRGPAAEGGSAVGASTAETLHSLDPRRRVAEPVVSAPAAPAGHKTGLPAEAFSTEKPLRHYPGRTNPRKSDLAITVLFTVVLFLLAIYYVTLAVTRADTLKPLLPGVQLANILAIALPIVLALFSTAFSILFLLRRVYAFWLPVFAGVLIVALYSVTSDLLNATIQRL